jgi:AcrR family transcriptional regulator
LCYFVCSKPVGEYGMNKKENVREKLLETSIKLFLAKGYAGASTNEIARLAGVSKGALYWYFKSKDDILGGILDRYCDEFIEEVTKKVNSCSGDFITKFKIFYKFSSEFAKDNKELLLVFSTLLIEFAGTGTDIEKRMKQINIQYNHIIRKMLEDGIQDGTVGKEIDPDVYAQFFTSTLMGSLFQWYLDDSIYKGDPALFVRYARANRAALLKIVLSAESSTMGGSATVDAHTDRGRKP